MDDKCTARLNRIKEQAEFCKQLSVRLSNKIQEQTELRWISDSIENYTQTRSDIIRLRRELMELSKLIGNQY